MIKDDKFKTFKIFLIFHFIPSFFISLVFLIYYEVCVQTYLIINKRRIIAMRRKQGDAEYEPRMRFKGQKIVPGKWTKAENRKYVAFLIEHKQSLENCGLRQEYGIYKQMSDKIAGRTSDQCRGHHRRMMQAYKTIEKIVEKLQKRQQNKEQQISGKGVEGEGRKQQKVTNVQSCKDNGTIDIMVSLDMNSLFQW